jgi:cytochrome b
MAGHNPVGGYSVLLLLGVLLVQVGTGLFAVDVDGLESGPLSFLVSFDQGRFAAEIHEIAFTALQVLVAVHILAIVIYRLRGSRLTRAMITGRADESDGFEGALIPAGLVALIAALTLAAAVAWWIGTGAPGL